MVNDILMVFGALFLGLFVALIFDWVIDQLF